MSTIFKVLALYFLGSSCSNHDLQLGSFFHDNVGQEAGNNFAFSCSGAGLRLVSGAVPPGRTRAGTEENPAAQEQRRSSDVQERGTRRTRRRSNSKSGSNVSNSPGAESSEDVRAAPLRTAKPGSSRKNAQEPALRTAKPSSSRKNAGFSRRTSGSRSPSGTSKKKRDENDRRSASKSNKSRSPSLFGGRARAGRPRVGSSHTSCTPAFLVRNQHSASVAAQEDVRTTEDPRLKYDPAPSTPETMYDPAGSRMGTPFDESEAEEVHRIRSTAAGERTTSHHRTTSDLGHDFSDVSGGPRKPSSTELPASLQLPSGADHEDTSMLTPRKETGTSNGFEDPDTSKCGQVKMKSPQPQRPGMPETNVKQISFDAGGYKKPSVPKGAADNWTQDLPPPPPEVGEPEAPPEPEKPGPPPQEQAGGGPDNKSRSPSPPQEQGRKSNKSRSPSPFGDARRPQGGGSFFTYRSTPAFQHQHSASVAAQEAARTTEDPRLKNSPATPSTMYTDSRMGTPLIDESEAEEVHRSRSTAAAGARTTSHRTTDLGHDFSDVSGGPRLPSSTELPASLQLPPGADHEDTSMLTPRNKETGASNRFDPDTSKCAQVKMKSPQPQRPGMLPIDDLLGKNFPSTSSAVDLLDQRASEEADLKRREREREMQVEHELHLQRTEAVKNTKPPGKLIIFDFDNTLFPTFLIQQLFPKHARKVIAGQFGEKANIYCHQATKHQTVDDTISCTEHFAKRMQETFLQIRDQKSDFKLSRENFCPRAFSPSTTVEHTFAEKHDQHLQQLYNMCWGFLTNFEERLSREERRIYSAILQMYVDPVTKQAPQQLVVDPKTKEQRAVPVYDNMWTLDTALSYRMFDWMSSHSDVSSSGTGLDVVPTTGDRQKAWKNYVDDVFEHMKKQPEPQNREFMSKLRIVDHLLVAFFETARRIAGTKNGGRVAIVTASGTSRQPRPYRGDKLHKPENIPFVEQMCKEFLPNFYQYLTKQGAYYLLNEEDDKTFRYKQNFGEMGQVENMDDVVSGSSKKIEIHVMSHWREAKKGIQAQRERLLGATAAVAGREERGEQAQSAHSDSFKTDVFKKLMRNNVELNIPFAEVLSFGDGEDEKEAMRELEKVVRLEHQGERQAKQVQEQGTMKMNDAAALTTYSDFISSSGAGAAFTGGLGLLAPERQHVFAPPSISSERHAEHELRGPSVRGLSRSHLRPGGDLSLLRNKHQMQPYVDSAADHRHAGSYGTEMQLPQLPVWTTPDETNIDRSRSTRPTARTSGASEVFFSSSPPPPKLSSYIFAPPGALIIDRFLFQLIAASRVLEQVHGEKGDEDRATSPATLPRGEVLSGVNQLLTAPEQRTDAGMQEEEKTYVDLRNRVQRFREKAPGTPCTEWEELGKDEGDSGRPGPQAAAASPSPPPRGDTCKADMILLEVPVRNLFARWSRKAQYEAKNARDGTTVKRPDSPSFLWPALCARRSGFFDQKLVLAFLTEGEEEGSPASEEKKQQLTIALRADSAALKADERQALTEMLKQVQNVSLLLPRVQGRVWNAAELQVLLKTSSKNGSELVAPRTWSAARIMEDHEHDQRQVGEQPEPSKILLNHFLDLAETEQHAYLLITHPVVEGVWSVEEEEQGREVEHTRKLHDHLHDDLRSGGLIQREVKARVVSRKLWLYGMPFRLVFPSNESNQLVYNKIPKLERIWAGEEDEG